MNYDHRFHAGNFADVFKHAVLTRILLYLQRKPAPFRFIDTHAGRGSYDLATDAAARTLEWMGGVGRLGAGALPAEAHALLAPYLAVAGDAIRGQGAYPGSPVLALHLLRRSDRMIFCELQPDAFAALKACVGRDRRAKAIAIDGYVGLNAFVPPVERRGLVLIDPPYEAEDEFGRSTEALVAAHAKWREGIFMLWYPIKDRCGVERLSAAIARAQIADVLRIEMAIAEPRADGPLVSNGLVVINPPYTLEAEMTCLLPELQKRLGTGRGRWCVDRLAVA